MSACRMELCPNWNGHGCIRQVLETCAPADDLVRDAEWDFVSSQQPRNIRPGDLR